MNSSTPQENPNPELENLPEESHIIRNHPIQNIIGDIDQGVLTRAQLQNLVDHMAFLSQIEPTNVKDALEHEDWIIAMQSELEQCLGISP